jgi:hypothetical protein
MKEILKEYYSTETEFVQVTFNKKLNDALSGKFDRRSVLRGDNFIIVPKYSPKGGDKRAYNWLIDSEKSKAGCILNIQKGLKIESVEPLIINQ